MAAIAQLAVDPTRMVTFEALLDVIEAGNHERDAAYQCGYDAGLFDGMDLGYQQAQDEADELRVGP
jgi:hypothetical protein